ncbi:acyltransferase [Actinoplanes sp. DH11]|uniref:acyltransferase family protein n=1 Tax=Actinoplanes sp. DH11 TaxID=2857011 RepID=UPI001E4F6360|nr:acyltransferase [Actinoplanes sp. DH11]
MTSKPGPTRSGPRPRLVVIDGLRILAALTVALWHYTGRDESVEIIWGVDNTKAFPGVDEFAVYGWMGVELFFMISGFVICMSCWGKTTGTFFRSRIVRLFPAYWAAALITTVVLKIWDSSAVKARDWYEVLTNLTMMQRPLGAGPVEGVYWTLWVEARFYLLFAFLVWFGLSLRRAVVFGYAWLIASVTLVRLEEPLINTMLMASYAPLFVAGIAFYLIHRFGSDIVLWGLVAFSYLLAQHHIIGRLRDVGKNEAHRQLSEHVGVGLITLFFVVMALIALGYTSKIQWRWLTTAGLLTYPFYLLHENIGWLIIEHLHEHLHWWVVLGGTTATMLVAAYLLHRLVERPLSAWLNTRIAAAASIPGRYRTAPDAPDETPAVRSEVPVAPASPEHAPAAQAPAAQVSMSQASVSPAPVSPAPIGPVSPGPVPDQRPGMDGDTLVLPAIRD